MVHWLIDVPDINVKVCGNLLGPLLDSNKNYAPEIFTQMVSSGAAFVIANPENTKDDLAVYTAALEGFVANLRVDSEDEAKFEMAVPRRPPRQTQ